MRSSRPAHRPLAVSFAALLAPLGALTLVGCPDPKGAFEDFGERYAEINPVQPSTSSGPQGCTAPPAGEADGTYLFSLSAKINKATPFALIATITTRDAGDGALEVDMEFQPLAKEDRATPVGSPFGFTNLPVAADGTFEWDLGEVTFPGEANPVSPSEVVAEVQLQGSMCDQDPVDGQSHDGFVCGSVTGIVSKPLSNYDLSPTSTFTMQLFEGTVPEALLDCDKTPAD